MNSGKVIYFLVRIVVTGVIYILVRIVVTARP